MIDYVLESFAAYFAKRPVPVLYESRTALRRPRDAYARRDRVSPKPLVEVGGRPILWHIMKLYAHYGFATSSCASDTKAA